MINFKEISQENIVSIFQELGLPSYRSMQTIHWIYDKLATSFDDMTSLPKALRESLKKNGFISNLKMLKVRSSNDGTQKVLFALEDGETIESVLIPNVNHIGRFTVCISSQVGCSLGCKFCLTGKIGFKRNLHNHEIVDQVITIKRLLNQGRLISRLHISDKEDRNKTPEITNIVLMGMGEPLNNFEEVNKALWKLTDLMGFSKRKITLSTAGVVHEMRRLADEGPGVNLAVSLNATTDDIRNSLMPINRKYPIRKLIQTCRDFPLEQRRRITFEYILLDSINDTREDARRLVKLLKGIRSKVNLIPYNPLSFNNLKPVNIFHSPVENRVIAFQNILKKAGLTAIIRRSMGAEISAACGQLKASYKV